MKKMLSSLIVIGILFLSGFGAIAVPNGEPVVKNTGYQPEIEVDIKGGLFFATVMFTNVGNESIEIDNVTINVDAPILLLGFHTPIPLDPPIELQPGASSDTYKSKFVFGIGPLLIVAHYHQPGCQWEHGNVTGFLLFFIMLVK